MHNADIYEEFKIKAITYQLISDMPQFCGGNPYFFSENLYQYVDPLSFIYSSMLYSENVHAIHIAMQFTKKKSRYWVIKIDSQQQITKIGALGLLHVARQSRIRPTPLIHGRRNLPFFGNLVKNASCVDDKKLFCFATHNS